MQRSPDTRISPQAAIGEVALTVADLERALAFYTQALGFELLRREGPEDAQEAVLGAGSTPLLTLRELPDAAALATVVARLDASGTPRHEELGAVAFEDPWRNTIRLTTPST